VKPRFVTKFRLAWICRILFEPKGTEPLREPGFGLLFPPLDTMPSAEWPHLPLVRSGQTYFVLSTAYGLGERAEPLVKYLSFCRSTGVFRKKLVPIPNRQQALEDYGRLISSDRWTAIKWKDRVRGFTAPFSEAETKAFLQSQAESISEK
jgi:hypothetical protein